MITINCYNEGCAVYVTEKLNEAFGADTVISSTGTVLTLCPSLARDEVGIAVKWYAFGVRMAYVELAKGGISESA